MGAKQCAIGAKFGNWTVIGEVSAHKTPSGSSKLNVLCRCACGTEKKVQVNNLTTGSSLRCVNCSVKVRAEKMRGPRKPDGTVNKKCAYGRYKQGAKKRKLVFRLTFEEFLKLAEQNCYYCNCAPSNCYNLKHSSGAKRGQPRAGTAFIHNGIDRINSKRGYSYSNCVPCCRRCNVAKNNMTVKDFFAWINAVHAHINTQRKGKNGTPVPSCNIQCKKVGRKT